MTFLFRCFKQKRHTRLFTELSANFNVGVWCMSIRGWRVLCHSALDWDGAGLFKCRIGAMSKKGILYRQQYRPRHRQGDRETGRKWDREIERQGERGRMREGERERGREGERERGREGEWERGKRGSGREGGREWRERWIDGERERKNTARGEEREKETDT